MTKYTVKFNYPEGVVYAGLYKGAAGWAPTLDTAWFFDERDHAEAVLAHAYGQASIEYGEVVEVDTP